MKDITTQLSYTVGIPIFWLADLYHAILVQYNTPLSLHHDFGWLKLWRDFLFFLQGI